MERIYPLCGSLRQKGYRVRFSMEFDPHKPPVYLLSLIHVVNITRGQYNFNSLSAVEEFLVDFYNRL